MGLSMDKDFVSGLGPVFQYLQAVEKPKVHDVQARREQYAAVPPPAPTIPSSVAFDILNITNDDEGGPGLSVYHLRLKEQPADGTPSSAVLHLHGGGLISLSPAVNVDQLARIVRDTGTQVFSVDYRLAPEHRYPAALDDAWSALAWVRKNATTLGVDTARIAVMGESAGGGLAAALTIRARDSGLVSPPIARQILYAPMLDDRTTSGSVPGEFTLWDAEDNLTGWTAYLGHAPGGPDVPETAAAARVKDVSGLPSLYLDTTQFDLFVGENLTYVRRFVEAGIEVESHIHPGLPHGFNGLLPSHQVSMQYEENYKRVIRSL